MIICKIGVRCSFYPIIVLFLHHMSPVTVESNLLFSLMLVICYQVTSHPAIEWPPDSKSLSISISYCLPCGLFKHFTSRLFIGCFETDQTLCSQGRGSFNQGKIAAFSAPTISSEIASRFVFKWRWEAIVPGMCWRSRSCVRIGVLLSTFRFSVCNCGVKNGLWSSSSPVDPCCWKEEPAGLQEIHSAERASKETPVRSWEELHGSQTCPQGALPLFGPTAKKWRSGSCLCSLHGRRQVSGCPTASGRTKAAAVHFGKAGVIVQLAALQRRHRLST